MDKTHKRCGTRAEFQSPGTNLAPIRMGTEILQVAPHLFSLYRSYKSTLISADLMSSKDDLKEPNSYKHFSGVKTSWSQQKGDRVQLSSTTFRFLWDVFPKH